MTKTDILLYGALLESDIYMLMDMVQLMRIQNYYKKR